MAKYSQFGQVMSPHDSDQMSQRSQVSRIAKGGKESVHCFVTFLPLMASLRWMFNTNKMAHTNIVMCFHVWCPGIHSMAIWVPCIEFENRCFDWKLRNRSDHCTEIKRIWDSFLLDTEELQAANLSGEKHSFQSVQEGVDWELAAQKRNMQHLAIDASAYMQKLGIVALHRKQSPSARV